MDDSPASGRLGTQELFPWVERSLGGKIAAAKLASGGNRCQGWLVDLETPAGRRPVFLRYQAFESAGGGPYSTRREAELYAALHGTGVPIAKLLALHERHEAMVIERLEGSAAYLRIKDEAQRVAVTTSAMQGLAALHQVDPAKLALPSFGKFATIEQATRAELSIWWGMYLESGRTDPLIEFGYAWLQKHLPPLQAPPTLVHGDTGPGNFMFDGSRFTGFIDWELAHLGDPMEDIAWFSMRSLLEPVPDFAARVRDYEAACGAPVDHARVHYHQVFVAWRVSIIRHCNVSGAVGASILTRMLNRRLLVETIAVLSNTAVRPFRPANPRPDRMLPEYDRVLEAIRDDIVGVSTDDRVITKAKDVVRAIKYLQQWHLIGDEVESRERSMVEQLLGGGPRTIVAGRDELSRRIRAGTIPFDGALHLFSEVVGLETQLAMNSMGALAHRHLPPLEDDNNE